MDLVDFDNVKAEKAKALRRYHRLQSIGRLFRAAEVCLALLFLCWTFTRLPFAVRISGEFLRRLASVVSSPLFMFVLGNSIVIALFAKTRAFSSDQTAAANAEADIYEAFVRSGEDRAKRFDGDQTEEIVYDDKQVIVAETISNSEFLARDCHAEMDSDSDTDPVSDHPKVYRRSKSEIYAKERPEIAVKRSLRRSETEKHRKIENSPEEVPADRIYPEDKLSNEEFQKTIEAFIAKQLMFRRQESLSVVLHNQA